MATFYTNEVTVGSTLSGYASTPWVPVDAPLSATRVVVAYFSGGTISSDARIAFNDSTVPLTTATSLVATFANTAGATVSSGTGAITYNRYLSGQPVSVIMADRTSFIGTLPATSTTMTLTNNLYGAWSLSEVRLRNLGII